MKLIGKIIAFIFVVQIGMWLAGRLAEKQAQQDTDPESENFSLATYVGGKHYTNNADKLNSGAAVTMFGGTHIDLTSSELDPGGASLRLKTRFGGVRVQVPDSWKVDLGGEAKNGENEIRVTDPATLPEDAPRLSVVADTQFGGVLVTT